MLHGLIELCVALRLEALRDHRLATSGQWNEQPLQKPVNVGERGDRQENIMPPRRPDEFHAAHCHDEAAVRVLDGLGKGHYVTAGTPDQIADFIGDWFQDGAADGFNIMPPLLPAQLDVFSAEVIPILQQRRLFRTEYEGWMLREHYGLPWPKSVFNDPAWKAEPLQDVAGV